MAEYRGHPALQCFDGMSYTQLGLGLVAESGKVVLHPRYLALVLFQSACMERPTILLSHSDFTYGPYFDSTQQWIDSDKGLQLISQCKWLKPGRPMIAGKQKTADRQKAEGSWPAKQRGSPAGMARGQGTGGCAQCARIHKVLQTQFNFFWGISVIFFTVIHHEYFSCSKKIFFFFCFF